MAHERINPLLHFDHLQLTSVQAERRRVAVVVGAMTVQRLLRTFGDRASPDR